METLQRNSSEKPLVSLIIPVYNVEKFLPAALHSVEVQNLRNFEAIIVNDGSPDGSQKIIDEFASRNPNFRVIIQENKGLGEARNTGIRAARADYLAFMDSDDIISPFFLQRLYEEITQKDADIVYCEYTFLFPSGKKVRLSPGREQLVNRDVAIGRLMRDISVHHFAWNKIYKKSLFVENGIEYPSICFEDIATTARLFYHAKKVGFIRDSLYYYMQRKGSIMATINYRRLQEHINAMAILRAFYDKQDAAEYFGTELAAARRTLTWNMFWDIFDMHLRIRSMSGTAKEISNAFRQISRFKKQKLPILGEPWEEIVLATVYKDETAPYHAASGKQSKTKPCFSFHPNKEEKKEQAAEA